LYTNDTEEDTPTTEKIEYNDDDAFNQNLHQNIQKFTIDFDNKIGKNINIYIKNNNDYSIDM